MGRKKISIDDLYAEVNRLLEEHAENVAEVVDEVAVDYAKIGVRQLREESPKRTGKYRKGWAYSKSKTRTGTEVTIYNKTEPQLTHLLEYGHAKRNGGRVPGKAHIKPVEEKIVDEFTDAIAVKIEAK